MQLHMTIRECIDMMNGFLDRLGSKGIRFKMIRDSFLRNDIAISFVDEFHDVFYTWDSVDSFLMGKRQYFRHNDSIWTYCKTIACAFDENKDSKWHYAYAVMAPGIEMPISDNDLTFLKLAGSSGSLEEFQVKMDLLGVE